MKVHNKAKHAFQHSMYDTQKGVTIIEIAAGEIKDIPDDIAQIWINTGEVVEFVEPKQAKELEDENAKLKTELDKLRAAAVEVKNLKPAQPKKSVKKSIKKK